MRTIALSELRNNSRRAGQLARAEAVITEHPTAILIECSDEKTGHRFGLAKCRIGQCQKIGHTTYQYQIWASWAPKDL